ncbi:MAG: hydroxyisourate hydrolase [Rhizomicrobium sp.]
MHETKGCFVGRLTTHVLDTAHGCPGAGIAVRLYTDDGFGPIAEATTNAEGRCDAPLLEGPTMKPGRYVLAFEAGDYFRRKGAVLAEPAFLDVVRVAFGIADASAHYHVPLLISPYGYSTYRGG